MKALLHISVTVLAGLLGYLFAGSVAPHNESAPLPPRPAAAEESAVASPALRGVPAADDVATVLNILSSLPSLADLAAAAEVLDRLTPAQMGDLVKRTLTMPLRAGESENTRTDRLGQLMRHWCERDPQAATAWIQPRLERWSRVPGFRSGYANGETVLVGAWARACPQLAMEAARRFPRSDLGYQLLWTTVFALEKDDARRFELLRGFPAGPAREKMMSSVLASWARADSTAALAALESLPEDATRIRALRTILPSSAPGRVVATFEQAVKLGVIDDPATLQRLAFVGGDNSPKPAAAWLEAQGADYVRRAGPALVLGWARKWPKGALDWARKHGIDIGASSLAGVDAETRSWMMGRGVFNDTPMQAAMQAHPEVVLDWLRSQPAGGDRDEAIVAALRAVREPHEMQPLLGMLSPDITPQGAEAIAQRLHLSGVKTGIEWAQRLPAGPTRTAAWAGLGKAHGAAIPPQLPPGPDRDALLRGMTQANYMVTSRPERAMERALMIDDAKLRRQTFDEVMQSWAANPKMRESAGPWLEAASVPQDWKARWREQLKPTGAATNGQ